MSKLICAQCRKVFDNVDGNHCPVAHHHTVYDFEKSDRFLEEKVRLAKEERISLNLDGLVSDLNSIIINVETENLSSAVEEFIKFTGYKLVESFDNDEFTTVILKLAGSADILVRARKFGENPFYLYNLNPKSEYLPNTRLETFVFESSDLAKYYAIKQEQDQQFMSDAIIEYDNYYFIQTKPSKYVNISYGIIQWKAAKRAYKCQTDLNFKLEIELTKPSYLKNIGYFDHAATRVRANDRDAAIIEFMKITNYDFSIAIYVKGSNSITNVARFTGPSFAMVFTSGIVPFRGLEESGPTENYIYNYGTRTHHLAFITENIEDTYDRLHKDGMEYLVELVGSPQQGLKQTFTQASPSTLIVNEYIHRYGDFKGFFTKDNVTKLTESTNLQ